MGFCNCSLFCCVLLDVHFSFAITLMEKRELAALLSLSSWCLGIVVRLFLVVPWVCLQIANSLTILERIYRSVKINVAVAARTMHVLRKR